MATIIVATIASICKKHNVTPEQFDKATYIIANQREGYYLVESQTTEGTEYKVSFNATYGVLQCTCPAQGKCWHMRAASASHEHYRQEQAARRQREQAEVESSAEYQLEQLFRDLEDTLDKLDEIAARADEREQSRRDAERTAYNYYELSIGVI